MAAVGMMSYPPRDSLQGYSQQYVHYASRAHQDQAATASSLAANSYASYASAPQQQSQAYQQSTRSARSSHSPTSDDGQKPSLPSISNLFGMVDGERSGQERAAKNAHANQSQQAQPQSQPQPQGQPQSYPATHSQPQPEQYQRQQHSEHPMRQQHQFHHPAQPPPQSVAVAPRAEPASHLPPNLQHDASNAQRAMIPPTPPMRTGSIGENTQSPSTISTGSSLSGQPFFIGSALNNVEADQQRALIPHLHKRPSVPTHAQTSPFGTSPYTTASAYSASPSALSASGSFYSPNQQPPGYPPSYQRPLPASFPPSAPLLPATNPWEHHHYIGPSAHATYPQTQERYICQTCNKAFSRPSSLKIHSHSHTGEKPFRCPHAGCGKAFSVRSNMKRHEKGCHSGVVGAVGGMGLGGQ